MDELVLFLVFFAIVGLVTALFRVFKPKRIVILQYQRGVLFNKGVVERVLDPGPYWITISKSITLIDIRLQTPECSRSGDPYSRRPFTQNLSRR